MSKVVNDSATAQGVAAWHSYMHHQNADGHKAQILRDLLAPEAVFHSPVVHTPQVGRDKVFAYLWGAAHVFADTGFTYVREMIDGNHALLEFTATIDGIHINGIDLITFDSNGTILDFKVMVRPMKGMNMLWEKMGAMLAQQA
ncbi:MAG: nuclear transport factor 2 family protein [Sphingopyxis sp.]|jgi:hypothetical protein|nr:nuclear transport factor 2 family protein [Sphingopyxis sp.]